MIRSLLIVSILIVFVIAFSCDGANSTMEIDCGKCFYPEPETFELEINLTIAETGDSVYVEIFKGNVESGELSWEGMVGTPLFFHNVELNDFYSVKATYETDDKIIYAIDGDRMISRYVADACDKDCWVIKGGYLDVRLKY